MISISIESNIYTWEELHAILSQYFYSKEDISEFLDAMLITGQIIKRREGYEVPGRIVAPRPRWRHVKIRAIPIGNRLGIDVYLYESKRRPERVSMTGLKLVPTIQPWIWVKDLDTIFPNEQISLVYEPGYRYRLFIPRRTVEAYGLKPGVYDVAIFGTPIMIREPRILQLWGYEYIVATTFEYESNDKRNTRALEIIGEKFINGVTINIRKDVERDTSKIRYLIIHKLLYDEDKEYYDTALHIDFEQIDEGASITPLIGETSKKPVVKFIDMDYNYTVLEWTTIQEFSHIPTKYDFAPPTRRYRGSRMK